MRPDSLSGGVSDRRARVQSTQLSEVGEVETFSNPHFAIEGFWSHEKGATQPTEVSYLLVLLANARQAGVRRWNFSASVQRSWSPANA